MAGLLSNLFDDGSSEGDGGSSSSTQEYDAGAEGGIDLSPSVGVSQESEANWTDADGTEHTYSSDTDVGVTVDVGAALGAAGSLTTADSDMA